MLGWSANLGNKLFGPDPKLEFRKPGQGLDLLSGPTIPIDAPYWHQYLTVFDVPSDVPLLLPSASLVHALHSNPLNVLTLVHFTASHLFHLLSSPTFPHSATGAGAGADPAREALNAVRVLTRIVPLVLAPRGTDAHGREVRDEVEDELFWRREKVPVASPRARDDERGGAQGVGVGTEDVPGDEGQFVLEDEDDDAEDDGATPAAPSDARAPSSSAPEAEYTELPPLAERLLGALVDLLFVPGFTIADGLGPQGSSLADEEDRSVVTYAIWEPGIASPAPATPAPPLPLACLSARLEILRLLTLLISLPSLLTPPPLFPSLPNRWREAFVSGRAAGNGDRNVVLCLLCSTLNTALNAGAASLASSSASSSHAATSPPASPSLTAGAGSGFDSLRSRAARLAHDTARRSSSGSSSGGGSSPSGAPSRIEGPHADEPSVRHALVGASLHFLGCVLVEHAPDASGASANQFAYYLAKLHRPGDFAFLVDGVLGAVEGALAAPVQGTSALGGMLAAVGVHLEPSSSASSASAGATPTSPSTSAAASRDPSRATEALTLLSRALDTNRKFAAYVARAGAGGNARLLELVCALAACATEWKDDDATLGVVRLASFVLQTLSAEIGAAVVGGEKEEEAREEVARVLGREIGPESVGGRLAGVVRRQVRAQGVDLGEEAAGAGGKSESKGVSFAEYLMITLHAVLLPSSSPSTSPTAPSRASLSTLYPSLLLTLSNLSPFVRDLGYDAAARLVRVWLAFSAPSWCLMEEGNPRLMYYLLETFNNIIHFHLDSNPHLLYALSITYKRFDLLANFTLAQGIAEARRLRAARRERQQQHSLRSISEDGPVPPSGGASALPGEHADDPATAGEGGGEGASEKSLGKRRERNLSLGGLSLADLSLASPPLGSATNASRSSLSLDAATAGAGGVAGEERPFVGRNGFVPTEAWVSSWREGLPLDTLLILLSELRPLLSAHDSSYPSSSGPPTASTISHLRTLLVSPSLTSLLPPSSAFPAPKQRRFVPSPASQTWFASLLYGRIYLALLPFLRDTLPVQLFAVAQAPGSAAAGGGAGAWRRGEGLVGGLSAGFGAEMERVGKTAVEVGGKVGETVRGVLGRFGGGGGGR